MLFHEAMIMDNSTANLLKRRERRLIPALALITQGLTSDVRTIATPVTLTLQTELPKTRLSPVLEVCPRSAHRRSDRSPLRIVLTVLFPDDPSVVEEATRETEVPPRSSHRLLSPPARGDAISAINIQPEETQH